MNIKRKRDELIKEGASKVSRCRRTYTEYWEGEGGEEGGGEGNWHNDGGGEKPTAKIRVRYGRLEKSCERCREDLRQTKMVRGDRALLLRSVDGGGEELIEERLRKSWRRSYGGRESRPQSTTREKRRFRKGEEDLTSSGGNHPSHSR